MQRTGVEVVSFRWCGQDPNGAIPSGTIWAIAVTSLTYLTVGLVCAGTLERAARPASGNGTSDSMFYDYQAMSLMSAWAPLNHAGCFAATLSTALSSYISCPKLMQVPPLPLSRFHRLSRNGDRFQLSA